MRGLDLRGLVVRRTGASGALAFAGFSSIEFDVSSHLAGDRVTFEARVVSSADTWHRSQFTATRHAVSDRLGSASRLGSVRVARGQGVSLHRRSRRTAVLATDQ